MDTPLNNPNDKAFSNRNIVFGIQDSLVSTCGMIVGVAASGMDRRAILTTGFILVLVEAMSMAFGSYLSEDSFMIITRQRHTTKDLLKYAGIMLGSYMAAGLVPMLPFFFTQTPTGRDITVSVGLSVAALYALILWIDQPKKNHKKASALAAIGSSILSISIFVGHAFRV